MLHNRWFVLLWCVGLFLFLSREGLANDFEAGKKALDQKDYLNAVQSFRAGVAKGDKQSPNALGELYVLGLGVDKDKGIACRLFLKGAKRGDAAAQHNYGICMAKGKASEPNYSKAHKWLSSAMDQGYKPAFCELGNLYISGNGTNKDAKRGFDLCLKGAKAGETKAASRVGELYFAGVGTKKNLKQAYRWLKKAGDKQHPSAAYNLGLMYLKGEGVARSEDKARRWFTVSALQRHVIAYVPAATLYRNKVMKLLDREDIDERSTRWAIFFLTLAHSIQTGPKQKAAYAKLIDLFSELSPRARRLADQDLAKWNANKT